ncbi:MAG: HAMP domain-containing histidine kinase [Nonomuraea sp.]|nr:HAMP domain-containing histidine kinase [Nonomuraea sp.]
MCLRLVVMVVVIACGFALPLAMGAAVEESRRLFDSRVLEAAVLADMAEPALASGDLARLRGDVRRARRACGCGLLVVDHEGHPVAAERMEMAPGGLDHRALATAAMSGHRFELPHVAWPWDARPYVVAAAIRYGDRPLGAVITVAPTADVRSALVTRLLLLMAAVGLVVAGATFLVIRPFMRWVLCPVHLVSELIEQVGSGAEALQVPETLGPPPARRLARGFNQMAVRVLHLVTRQQEFVAQASHQLRNPLTVLRLGVDNALELGALPGGKSEDLKLALSEVDRLSAIVDSLLLLAKSEEPDSLPVLVDVSAVANQRMEAWRPAYDRNGVPLISSIPDGASALCLPELIEHGLDALLDNALKFGRKAAVRVAVHRRGDCVEVVVRDQGPGLPRQDMDFIGTRFWRSSLHQNIPGTGLGLAIVRRLAQECGGTVTMAPGRPHGLEVRISVPSAPRTGSPDGDGPR